MPNCSVCQIEFQSKVSHAKFCSRKCKQVFRNRARREAGKKLERTCRGCGVEFLPAPDRGKFKPAIWCSDECRISDRLRKRRDTCLRFDYGLSLTEYEEIRRTQNDKCAICSSDNSKSKNGSGWCVDHDHKTGEVRGLLCHPCNRGLGQFQDDVEVMRKAIKYLEKK